MARLTALRRTLANGDSEIGRGVNQWERLPVWIFIKQKKAPTAAHDFGNGEGKHLHGRVEVLVDLFQEPFCGQPALIRTNQQRQIFGHEAGFNRVHDYFFERLNKLHKFRVIVEFCAVL